MLKSKLTYGLFVIAAILFVCKPFVGFQLYRTLNGHASGNSLVVKVFAKRKPEDLREASKRQAAISKLLSNPPLQLLATIFAMVGLFLSRLVTRNLIKLNLSEKIKHSPLIYLLTGKLVI